MQNSKNPHVDAFIFAKYANQIFPNITPEAIRSSLAEYFTFVPDQEEVDIFIKKFEPNKAKSHIIKALKDLGLSQFHISQLTGMSQSMVSRYANRIEEKAYMPNNYRNYISHQYMLLNNKKYYEFYTRYFQVRSASKPSYM